MSATANRIKAIITAAPLRIMLRRFIMPSSNAYVFRARLKARFGTNSPSIFMISGFLPAIRGETESLAFCNEFRSASEKCLELHSALSVGSQAEGLRAGAVPSAGLAVGLESFRISSALLKPRPDEKSARACTVFSLQAAPARLVYYGRRRLSTRRALFEDAARRERDCGGDCLDQARVRGRGYDDRRHGVRTAGNGRIAGKSSMNSVVPNL